MTFSYGLEARPQKQSKTLSIVTNLKYYKSRRPLLAAVALAVALSVVSVPMANAQFYNYVRDAFTGWESGAWTDLKADANVAACQPAAQGYSGQSWMVEPLTAYLENTQFQGGANWGYLEAFYSSASAYRSWYLYYAFNDIANLSSYLTTIQGIDDAYDELIQAYSDLYRDEYGAAEAALSSALNSAPADQLESWGATVPAVFNAYYDAKTANDDYYNYAIGQYAYNTWSFYDAPLYGTTVFLSRLSSLVSDQFSNSVYAALYDYGLFPYSPDSDVDGYVAYQDQLGAYYYPLIEYYSAYTSYYNSLSDYYEG